MTLLLCGVSLTVGRVESAEEGFVPKSVDVPRLKEPVRIDGRLTAECLLLATLGAFIGRLLRLSAASHRSALVVGSTLIDGRPGGGRWLRSMGPFNARHCSEAGREVGASMPSLSPKR